MFCILHNDKSNIPEFILIYTSPEVEGSLLRSVALKIKL